MFMKTQFFTGPSKQPSDLKFKVMGIGAFVFAASLHSYRFVIELHYLRKVHQAAVLSSSFFAEFELFFTLVFLVSLIGLLINRLTGMILSILGLAGVITAHVLWYSYSYGTLRALETDIYLKKHPELFPQHFAGLLGAGWWDIVVLIFVVLCLAWRIKSLVGTLRHG
jgi:hypothetical protein